jgi:lantibiotic modifying enzyme
MSKRKSHEEAEPPREFPNPFADYAGKQLTAANGKVTDEIASQLRRHISRLVQRLETEYNESSIDYRDYTVYTGTSGVGLLYFHMHDKLDTGTAGVSDRYLQTAVSYIDGAIGQLRHRGVSFLCGDAGPLALGAVIYSRLNRSRDSTSCIDRLLSLSQQVLTDTSLPDELLFGRCGYLFALLFVRHHLGDSVIPSSVVRQVSVTVLESGRAMSRAQKSNSALMYEWHGKKYLGAAHGLAGILHTLMLVDDAALKSELQNCIRPTLDFLMSLRFPSGNYPSSIGSSSGDLLIHWCHGAPGWIHTFALAYKVLGDTKFLEAVKDCAEVLWKRGILRKGYGICHGVAGNAYGFLIAYQLTGDQKYLYRATKFAEWCFDYGKHGCRTPDRPYSLFEGLAGTIYFLVDLLDPQNAKFPAFQL